MVATGLTGLTIAVKGRDYRPVLPWEENSYSSD